MNKDATNIAVFDPNKAVEPTDKETDNALKLICEAMAVCKEKPSIFMSEDFLRAYKYIRETNTEEAAKIRIEIKEKKHSGTRMSDIDSGSKPDGDGGDNNVATELIELARKKGELFYDKETERGYITVSINNIPHTMLINGRQFVEWISHQFYTSTGQSANEVAIKQAKFALSGIARHDGKKQRIYLRVADHEDSHYIFLADDKMRSIEVSPTGWRIVGHKIPVKFCKPPTMQPLPIPEENGNLDLLWKFVNVDENERPLLLAWMLESYRSETPKPVLSLSGTQGSAKSSTQDKIRQIIDNNSVNLRSAPKTPQDIFVGAGCNWLISYENLSHLSAQTQDSFCTLATGGGYAAKKLYTDDEESVIKAKRPIIINSIPTVITAQDLTDRAICLELPQISYREEMEIQKEWLDAIPAIFGGLLDLFVKTLQKIPDVNLIKPPRMADFTRLGEAMMQAQGKPSGEFIKLYRANLDEGVSRAVESSPAALAVIEMSEPYTTGQVFHGTANTLFEKLIKEYKHDSENWPRSARGLTEILRRQSPALACFGIKVTVGKKKERVGSEQGFPVIIKKVVSGNVGNVVSEVLCGKKSFSDSLRL